MNIPPKVFNPVYVAPTPLLAVTAAGNVPPGGDNRVTDAGDSRVTEIGDQRITE